jgi:hypothetical protein
VMAMGIRKVGDDSGSVYDTEWFKEYAVKAERGNREHIAKYDRSFNGIMAKADAKSRDLADGDELDRDAGGGASDHHASKVADLLVESGSHPDRSAALSYLLHSPHGAALLHRMSKKETTPMKDTLHSIMKSGGIAATCAAIIAKGRTTISQDDLVSAVGKIARELWSELSEAQAFSKVYSDSGAEGRVVRDAIRVAKESLAETMLGPGLPVQVVGGPGAMLDAANNDQSDVEQARAEVMRIGRKQYPRLSEAQVFEAAFTDPRNASTVARLYQRPTPTSIYPLPNEWLRGEGSQHAKADSGSAYDDLMLKAEEYRNAHPELSISQAFEKIYTNPANVELAKRERLESVPR